MLVFPSIDLSFFGLWRNKIPSFEVLLTSTDRAIQFFVTPCVLLVFCWPVLDHFSAFHSLVTVRFLFIIQLCTSLCTTDQIQSKYLFFHFPCLIDIVSSAIHWIHTVRKYLIFAEVARGRDYNLLSRVYRIFLHYEKCKKKERKWYVQNQQRGQHKNV